MSRIIHYFAYGSNMNPQRVEDRGLNVVNAYGGCLYDFDLVFNKMSRDHEGVGHANIRYQPGRRTEGVLYELADVHEIFKMDPYERAPWNYGREVVTVAHPGGQTWAWTYFANPAVLRHDLKPPASYLDHLLAGQPFLSEDYYASLAALRDALG
jgi:YD repeat-containing protein